ncbi:hypothetical protein [Parapedobacter sp. 10938]|uniref:hypothetical protein n=1 Tax=Parapedobacter flavus TaxID=3110225 RepID=UPI002DB958FF|nr:hypothetical protein [Parapedobacter sp. 10938]MEC3878932.1 hypothetical protein [Parapedobacter sp. 10938]
MYHHATSNPLSRLRFLVACAVLLLGAVKEGYGQRVYANSTQISPKQSPLGIVLSEVTNPDRAIDEDNLNNFSSLNSVLGALGVVGSASQNLQFVGDNAFDPLRPTPIMIKFGSGSSLLGLVSGISLRFTDNSLENEVGTNYTDASLLSLLNGSTASEVILPIPASTTDYDGIRLKISAVVGLSLSAQLYYAFYITPPQIDNNEIYRCDDESGQITISNFQAGYTYRLFTDEIGGTEVEAAVSTSSILTIPPTIVSGEYWVEARENDIYPSARTKITLVRNNVTGGVITADQALCANVTPAQLSETTPSTGPGTLTYQWQRKTTDDYTDIPGASSPSYAPPILSETTTYRRRTRSTDGTHQCDAFSNEITITVYPVPTISLNASTIRACQEDDEANFPYSTVTNTPVSYSIHWNSTARAMGFQDVYNETHNFSDAGGSIPISIPPDALEGTYQGVLTIRNSLDCTSAGQTLIINVLPKPTAPDLNINPNSQY